MIIKNIDDINKALEINEHVSFAILLNGGCHSRKEIRNNHDGTYDLYHSISDCWEEDLTEKQLLDASLISEAMEHNAFITL